MGIKEDFLSYTKWGATKFTDVFTIPFTNAGKTDGLKWHLQEIRQKTYDAIAAIENMFSTTGEPNKLVQFDDSGKTRGIFENVKGYNFFGLPQARYNEIFLDGVALINSGIVDIYGGNYDTGIIVEDRNFRVVFEGIIQANYTGGAQSINDSIIEMTKASNEYYFDGFTIKISVINNKLNFSIKHNSNTSSFLYVLGKLKCFNVGGDGQNENYYINSKSGSYFKSLVTENLDVSTNLVRRNNSIGSGMNFGTVDIKMGFAEETFKVLEVYKTSNNTTGLKFYTELGYNLSNEVLDISPTGRMSVKEGIRFSAIQVTSSDPNTLDDYEEGTWTPALTGTSGGSVTCGASNYGNYTKIGNRVFITGCLHWINIDIPISGLRQIRGLPFTNKDLTRFSVETGGTDSSYGKNSLTASVGKTVCLLGELNADFLWIAEKNLQTGEICLDSVQIANDGILYSFSATYTI